jgi:hypothetical protein
MRELMNQLNKIQERNVEQKGINFSEEGLNSLYELALEANEQYYTDLKTATVKGILIGAASTGLVGVGIWGFNKFRKRNSGDDGGETVEQLGDNSKKIFKTKVIKIKDGEVKKASKVDKEALSAIIKELNENEKNVKH